MILSKYLIGHPARFDNINYFWNLQNFSFLSLAVCLSLGILRTAIWNNQVGSIKGRSSSTEVLQSKIEPTVVYNPQTQTRVLINGRASTNQRTSVLSVLSEDLSHQIKKTSKTLRRRSSQILDYKPATEHNSILAELKTLKLWSHTLQLNFSNLPYYTFIGYINQFMIHKGLDKIQQSQVLNVGGYLLLSVAVTGYLHGMVVNRMDHKLGHKKSVLVLLILTYFFNLMAIIFAVFGPKTDNLLFINIAYFLMICTSVFNWANCYCGIGLLWPKEMHGQCYGFCNMVDGAVGFLPVAMFGRSSGMEITTGLLILAGSMTILTILHVFLLYKIKR